MGDRKGKVEEACLDMVHVKVGLLVNGCCNLMPVLLMTSGAEVGQRQVAECYLIGVLNKQKKNNAVRAVGSGDLSPVQIGRW